MTTGRITVIVNARAGSNASNCEQLRALFEAQGLDVVVREAEDGDEVVQFAREALAQNPRMIVAGGGDGTISAVAAAVAGTDVALGILPLGTLNHFARDLRIPPDLEAAVKVIGSGHVAKLDAGEVNGRVFLNNSGIGLYPRLVHQRERMQQRLGRGKWQALLRAALTLLHRYPTLDVRVRTGDTEFTRRTPLVFVGNNAYAMSGLSIGTRARLDSGMLSLYIPRRPGRLALFGIALRALFGLLHATDDFDSLEAPEIRIDTRRKHTRVSIDGEVAGAQTPLHYRILPKALNVIVPQPEAGTEGAN